MLPGFLTAANIGKQYAPIPDLELIGGIVCGIIAGSNVTT